jgi:antitoxin (DNA-binding transcriptional repressor) of toxin-antitoxin stability system
MECDIRYAKTSLSKLSKLVESGEVFFIFITRRGQRVAQLNPVSKPKPRLGTLKGLVGPIPDSSLFAMSDAEAGDFLKGTW